MNTPAKSFSVVKRGCFKTSNINNKSKARKLNFAFITSTDVTASTLRLSRRAAAILSAPPPTIRRRAADSLSVTIFSCAQIVSSFHNLIMCHLFWFESIG